MGKRACWYIKKIVNEEIWSFYVQTLCNFSSQYEIQDFFMQGYNNVMGAVSIRDKLIGKSSWVFLGTNLALSSTRANF